jgi:hypothetical protein
MPDRPLTAPELAAMFEATDNAELARQERAMKAENTDRLAEILARADKATDGPWFVEAHQPTLTRRVVSDDHMLDASLGYLGNSNQADAAFIAAARTDVPRLVAELVEARARLAAVLAACDAADQQHPDTGYIRKPVIGIDTVRQAAEARAEMTA